MVQIDWANVKTERDLDKIPKEALFDEFDSHAGGSAPQINPNLPDDEIEIAFQWLELIPDLNGVVLIIGEEGQGKTMLAHALAFDGKYLFNKLAVLDKPPRAAFGRYVPFSTEFLKEQLARLQEMTTSGCVTREGKWVCDRGQVLIRRAIIMMDEFGTEHMSRLSAPNIEPKKTLVSLASLNRHLQALFLGVGTELNDFDRHYFPHVDYIIECTRLDEPPYAPDGSGILIGARVQKVKFNRTRDKFMPIGPPGGIILDGSKPRPYLKGLAYKDLFHTDNVQAIPISKSMRISREE